MPIKTANSTPTVEQITSLAKTIHEGDWMMRLEWRWDRATTHEQHTATRQAHAVLEAHTNGATTATDYATVLDAINPDRSPGWPGRLNAKARKVVEWFEFHQRGYLL